MKSVGRLRGRRGMATVEWIILVIVFGLGLVAGAWAVRNALVQEYTELIQAIETVDLQDCLTK
ncbi:MAG: hypothetical protein NZ602_00015 [Thermoguttaceae bacterium]|nr:hypothetical protein [Thermoguttaceae bacterium]